MAWRPGNWASGATHSASPPPPQSSQSALRSYTPSPLGRRPFIGPRPTLARRASSLNLGPSPNASTASLPGTAQQPPTMGYRSAVSAPPPAGVKDPLEALVTILGIEMGTEMGNGGLLDDDWMPEPEEAEGVEFGGLGLEGYVQRAGFGGANCTSQPQDFEREREKFQDLHRSIKACDEVLRSVEAYLSSFETDLGTVSTEIESLQNRSTSLSQKLNNRKEVEKLLAPAIEDIVIPPKDIRRLVEGEVNDSWVKALHDTDRRMKAIDRMDAANIKAVREVKPEFENITHKTIERTRDFFVSRIKALRLPGANAQVIQKSGFLQHKELFRFMANHHSKLADEICQAYSNTMRWYYHTHFQRYQKSLEKIRLHIIDKNDTVGQEEPVRKGALIPGLRSTPGSTHDPFNIGRRIDILRNRTAPILSAHQAEDDKGSHYVEYAFRHFNAALIENASAEYTFLTEFFAHAKHTEIVALFNRIFEQTFALGQAYIKFLVDSSFDAIGLLLCVRLNQYSALEMQKRLIPTAEGYINAVNMLLWPRFQIVMSAHSDSLRRLLNNKAAITVPASKQSAAPHPLTQRFASLLHALLSLSAEAGDDEPVFNSLGRLRNDYEAFMTKFSAGIADARKRERFLFNNYSLVSTIIGDTDGKLAVEQKQQFERLKKAYLE